MPVNLEKSELFNRSSETSDLDIVGDGLTFFSHFSIFKAEPTMLNGLYSSATALDGLSRQQEAIASNLAHLNTPGHRRMVFSFVERLDAETETTARPGMKVERQAADFSEGPMQDTGRPLDLALHGDAFFVYEGTEGEMFSRSGVVFRDPETNQLRNGDGFPLLDSYRKPITYEGALSDLVIGADGTLSQAGPTAFQTLGKLAIVQFNDNQLLQSENQTYFRLGTATESPAENFTLRQGAREMSNASPVTEMISLMVGSRHFEMSQRAIRMISESLQQQVRS